MNIERKVIAIDCDGTIVTHEYPRMGKAIPNAIEVIKKLKKAGHILILLTMRGRGNYLKDAIEYSQAAGLEFDFYNCYPPQARWTNSEKVYYDILVDDAAFGCPLINDGFSDRAYVDWFKVEEGLIERKVL